MARVPIENLPQVGQNVPPSVRMSPSAPDGAFGGGQAAANVFGQARGLADDLMRQEMAERQKADMAAVFKASAELSNYVTDAQYNDKTGIVAQKGENAFPLAKSVPEAYKKRVSEIMGTLSSPEQRQAFQREADQSWGNMNRFNQHHIAGQRQQYVAQQADAFVDSQHNAASLAGSSLDFGAIASAADAVESSRRAWAASNGVAPEVANAMVARDLSRTYTLATISMLDAKNDLAASRFFAENSSKMTPEDRHRLSGPLKLGSTLGEAQRTVDSYFSGPLERVPTGGNNWVERRGKPVETMNDVIALTQKIDNADVRAEVERLARQRFADVRLAEKQQNDNAFMAIAKRIEQHPGIDPRGLATPDEWENQLTDPDMKTALKRLAFPKEEQERLALTNLVLTPDKELAGYSDAQVLARYGAHMYEKAVDRRNAIRKGGPAYDANRLYDDTLMSVFVKSGLGGVKPSDTAEDIKKDDKKQVALMKFWEQVERGRSMDQKATGKKADDETTRKKAEEAVLFLQKKINVLGNLNPLNLRNVTRERAIGDLTDYDLTESDLDMPLEFSQPLFRFAESRPNTMAKGTDFATWREKDRVAINRAYLAFLAGANQAEVRASYLRGK